MIAHPRTPRKELVQAATRALYVVPALLVLGTLGLVLHYGFDTRLGGATATLWLVGGPLLAFACAGIGILFRLATAGRTRSPAASGAALEREYRRRAALAWAGAVAAFVLAYAFLSYWGMFAVTFIAFFGRMSGPAALAFHAVRAAAAIAAFLLARHLYRRVRRR